MVYSTGEGWPVAMWDNSADLSNGAIMNKNNGSHLSFVFYMAQTLICDYIFLSLIQIIIIEQFEKYYLPKDNTINIFKKDVEKFKLVWHHFSQEKFNCIKIKESQLVEFIKRLGDEGDSQLGFDKKYYSDRDIQKKIIKMSIKSIKGYVFFNELLYRCMKIKYGDMKINKKM